MSSKEKLERVWELQRKYEAEILKSVRDMKAKGQKRQAIKLISMVFDFSLNDAMKYYEVA